MSHWEGVEASQTAVDEVSRCPGINLSVLDKQVMNGSVPFVSLFFYVDGDVHASLFYIMIGLI